MPETSKTKKEIQDLIDQVVQINQGHDNCAEVINKLQSAIDDLCEQQNRRYKEKQAILMKLQDLIKNATVVYANKSYSLKKIKVLPEEEENYQDELVLRCEAFYNLDGDNDNNDPY